jgi:hypothetical protein
MWCGSIRAGFVISAMGVAAANLSACSAQHATRLPDKGTVSVERIDGPYLAAGTDFDVELEHPLRGWGEATGETFVARVRKPLVAPRGGVVAPAGALVTGRAIQLTEVVGAPFGLKIQTMDTVQGRAPVHATVESAGSYATVGFIEPSKVRTAEPLALDAVLAPRRAAIGGGPPEGGDANPQTAGLASIPKGAVIRLVLMERLIPPGTRVENPPPELLASPPPAPQVKDITRDAP